MSSNDFSQVPGAAASAVNPIAHPLDELYARMGLTLPVIHRLPSEGLPQPYQSLLVHVRDMTPTLEGFHLGRLRLRVLRREQREGSYLRGVVLLLEGSDRAVAFGAIKINLSLFSTSAQNEILKEQVPLGRILADLEIPHDSRPRTYFAVEADDFIAQALSCPRQTVLYGRRNALLDANERSLADIVEILPPLEPRPRR